MAETIRYLNMVMYTMFLTDCSCFREDKPFIIG